MGRNKALLPSHGRTLVEVVAGALWTITGRASLVGGSRRVAFPEFGFVPDLYPGQGPLGGIISALDDSKADWNLIVACDMPGLKVDFLRQLLDFAEHSRAEAIIPVGSSGQWEPLCSAYHRDARPGLQAAFDRGVRKIATALEEVRTVTWPVPEELSCFQNVNTPEEWAPYER
jgi:molybdopterin-guanine dinucleotide biosynthesis protein A